MKIKLKTRDLTYISIFIAIIAICSWISIPMTIPFTLQTFAIFITIGLLGTFKSFIAILLYVFLGAIGLPIFSNFTGGLGILFGPTGGYILGFLFTSVITGKLIDLLPKKNIFLIIAMLTGLLTCYFLGTIWFVLVYTNSSGSISIYRALSLCVFPFIIPDLVKIGLASIIINKLKGKINL
ncbi:biotin transporter BioY [Miniphocaeibacter halophilus]|uniref:Biotin transporter BioY n=1 Tax=Miniphocaeibacter halophilus TaxID=2931922 RepID=A0AC61N260_9FIRM|nr:biotin transporter BioY [Miniphocaeibacter halophilus]QQK08823.1 biotin transporter BioY [Miniphocaeibacter halophilus]